MSIVPRNKVPFWTSNPKNTPNYTPNWPQIDPKLTPKMTSNWGHFWPFFDPFLTYATPLRTPFFVQIFRLRIIRNSCFPGFDLMPPIPQIPPPTLHPPPNYPVFPPNSRVFRRCSLRDRVSYLRYLRCQPLHSIEIRHHIWNQTLDVYLIRNPFSHLFHSTYNAPFLQVTFPSWELFGTLPRSPRITLIKLKRNNKNYFRIA